MLANTFGVDWLKLDLPFACDIHFSFRRPNPHPDRYQVLWIFSEPEGIRISEEELRDCWLNFDLILSHDRRHQYPNVVRHIFWTSWVSKLPPIKRFEVSNIFSVGGGPISLQGYQLRAQLLSRREEITIPRQFYMSQRFSEWERIGLPPLINDRRDCLFESMFNICIENQNEPDFFTEKLVDCFQTYTVPIYYGCPNLAEHGIEEDCIIRFETMDECIDRCNSLTLEDYYSRLPSLHQNRKLRRKQPSINDGVKEIIVSEYSRKGFTRLQV